ncbi:uncharacterized protein PHACADRAFT_266353, partial [Phanerochaete carnosa HHB-10118-sp]
NLTGGSICPTGGFNIMAELPANINDNGGEPLPMPNTSAPVYTTLSVGMQNYTCGCDGQWAYAQGGLTYLFDISCLPQMHHKPFTSFIAAIWDSAPPTVTNQDFEALVEGINPGVGLGLHYWIPNPINASAGISAVWDFSKAERFQNDTNKANAFLVAAETGNVPDPINPVINSPWLYEPVLDVNGQPDGQLATQVYRFNSNGGQAPNTSCTPGAPTLQVKSTLDFYFYGGAWEDTIQQ